MKANSNFKIQNSKRKQAAFLWDESFLWGIMAHDALTGNGLVFDLIRSEDIRKGRLKEYSLLFVPGGWASNKLKALGDSGVAEIKRFVQDGGSYVGFCGGAGLATLDGIGLLNVKRRPTKERVPSFSGPVRLHVRPHPIWNGLGPSAERADSRDPELRTANSEPVFHAWWPSQFIADQDVSVLATYGAAMPESFSSDINVGDAEAHGGWEQLEQLYQINLDPKRLFGEPAVIEGHFGSGSVILSLVHFDTPGDEQGAAVLRNLWSYFLPDQVMLKSAASPDDRCKSKQNLSPDLEQVRCAVSEVIALGERNFLWYWRNPFLLQWRRGVRGLEYCTLSIMVGTIARLISRQNGQQVFDREMVAAITDFADKAKRLLLLERQAMQAGTITYERCDDPRIQKLRDELFSHSKSYGGRFKELLDRIDGVLYRLFTTKAAPL